ncbi:tRNA (N6-threonylcarbamoyladenosine(37)-N6)-methyltransferase TrmO [Desulfoluna sp.]|uniref:tRNA (N6-threonylcarbamoyladenosine(37)-N6)-methyltransferase TrmO n=1 Tax=Desulfoluna sp. TaxID=2045199 RepID=UPI002637F283|nr:tRNA (N6-threonylcarbamoyladenosine(37)-N6)-methyltransferase TrmO [Desulfoluna sp.]
MNSSPLLTPIGTVHSCFTEKFGVPRQPGIVTEATGTIELLAPYNRSEAVRDLDGFSHLWIIFLFNRSARGEWKPMVRPPRLGGNKKVGVFASRSNFRPNPIGLSVVRLLSVSDEKGKILIHVKGLDILDGTPVLDIKPYIPYVDAIDDATGGFAPEKPEPRLSVTFAPEAELALQGLSETAYPNLRDLIAGVVEQDPRPAYYDAKKKDASFGFCLWDLNIRWKAQGTMATITEITR